MQSYGVLIDKELVGESPKEQYDNLCLMKSLLKRIAFPGRGTEDETMDIYGFAEVIVNKFPNIKDWE